MSLAGRTGDSSAVSEHRAASLPVLCSLPHLPTRPYWRDVLSPGCSAEQKRAPSHWSSTDDGGGWSSLTPALSGPPGQLPPQANASHILAILALTLGLSRPRCRNSSRPGLLQVPSHLRPADRVWPLACRCAASAKVSGSCTCLERDQACILAAPVAHD